MSSGSGLPRVLVVDDEPEVADMLAFKLEGGYETAVAYGGEEALDLLDADVDAVLLDRRMPDLHGDDVLDAIREGEYDPVVVMVTAVDPDLEILKMDFDDYLCKPVAGETLRRTLDRQLAARPATDPRLEEFFTLVSKLDVLEEELSPAELARNDEYEQLETQVRDLADDLDEDHADFDEIVATFRDISRGSS